MKEVRKKKGEAYLDLRVANVRLILNISLSRSAALPFFFFAFSSLSTIMAFALEIDWEKDLLMVLRKSSEVSGVKRVLNTDLGV